MTSPHQPGPPQQPPTESTHARPRQPAADGPEAIDPNRYKKVRWFFAKMLLEMIVLDVIFSLPLLRWIKPPALPRWRKVARRYKAMAIEMGGVLIKLGQFVSTRVDILPPEVLHELAGLQDRVAPAEFTAVVGQVEKDLAFGVGGPEHAQVVARSAEDVTLRTGQWLIP